MDLRPYQQRAIEEIREHFRKGTKKVLLHLATGGGKTHCFSYMMIQSRERGMKSMMVVRGRQLVEQGSKRLWHEDVTHGVWMAGHWNYRPQAPVQVASVDTLHSRKIYPPCDLLVIDEAHMATSKAYKTLIEMYPNAFVVAVTATPYVKGGLRHLADAVVHPVTIKELIDEGFLVPPKYYAPEKPDLSGVAYSKATGDYVQDQLALVMNKSAITGSIIDHWKKLALDRPTLCFAVNIQHSKSIAEDFRSAGIPAEHADADTPDDERERLIGDLKIGKIKVLVNVGIMCTGVDIPHASCLIMARPTQSYNLYIQQAGRGTRTCPELGKRDFILLDHAGNVHRHGYIEEEMECDLDGNDMRKREATTLKTCEMCYAVFDTKKFDACPQCGWEIPAKERKPKEINERDGELSQLHYAPSTVRPIDRLEAEEDCETWLKQGGNPWRSFYRVKDKYGAEIAKIVFFRCCKRLGISPPKAGTRALGTVGS